MADKRTGKARQGKHPQAPEPTLEPGHKALYKTTSGQAAQKVIAKAARNDQRVDIKIKDKQGNVHQIVSNKWKGHNRQPGKSAKWIKKQTGTTAKDMKVFAAQQTEKGDPAQSDAWGKPIDWFDVEEIQILVYL